MFINKTNIKLLAAALMTALSAPSCLNLDETQDTGYGYLTISGLDLDVQVEQLVPTKAESVDISGIKGYSDPSVSSVTVTSKIDASKTYTWKGGNLKLPAGTYTLSATSGLNGFDAPYFVGTGEVEVSALATAEGTVTFILGNSVIQVINDKSGHIDSSKQMTISSSEVSGEVKTDFGSYVFVPSGKSLTLSGSNAAGTGFSYTLDPLVPCKAYDVTLTPSGLPKLELSGAQMLIGTTLTILTPATITGSANSASIVYEATTDAEWDTANMKSSTEKNGVHVIEGLTPGSNYKVRARIGAIVSAPVEITPISVSADHSYTNDLLDGTDLKISNVPASLRNKITFTLKQGNKTYRTDVKDTSEIDSDGSAITATNGWPYLPQGEYELIATVTLTENETVSSKMDVSVGAPTFTPTVSLGNTSYTSYDKYAGTNNIATRINGDSTVGSTMGANNCQPETLYSPSAIIGGISENLIKNSNYTKTISFAVDGTTKCEYNLNEMTSNTKTGDNIPSLSWGSHTLTATFTFEGKSVTASKTHHITGLPYRSPDFLSSSIEMKLSSVAKITDWVYNGNVEYWKGRGYQILKFYLGGVEAGNLYSPAFQVPNNTNISYSLPVCYFTTGLGNSNIDLYTGVTNNFSKVTTSTTSISRVTSDSDPKIGKFTNVKKTDTMIPNGRISISTDEEKDGNLAENWFTVGALTVLYSE